MNKLTRGIAIASVAGTALLGGAALNTVATGAQEAGPDATEEVAPETGETTPGDREGCDHGRRHRGPNLEVAADTIGIEVEALRDALHEGSTLAEIAEANGSSAQAVIDALVADVESHLDEAVAEGDLSEQEAAEKLAEATERITTAVTEGKPEGEGARRPHGPRGPGGPGGEELPEDADVQGS